MTGDALKTCNDAGNVGTAIGVGLIIGLWAAADVILGQLPTQHTRSTTRPIKKTRHHGPHLAKPY